MVDVQTVRMVIGFIIILIFVGLVLRSIIHRLDVIESKLKKERFSRTAPEQ
jgi:hypothetical protein